MTCPPSPAAQAGIAVRPARPGEYDAAGQVVRLAYAGGGFASGDYLDIVADARDRSRDAEVAVAVDRSGAVVGSVTFALPGSRWAELSGSGEAEFRMLGVHPGAQRRGVGLALTRWCIDRAAGLGARRLLLCSLPEMTTAHRLYQRLGFARRPDLDLTPAPGLTLLAFSLELGPGHQHPPTEGPRLRAEPRPASAPGQAPAPNARR